MEFSKPLFDSDDEAVIAETRATMAWVLDQCLLLLHPFMPFITEELWGTLGRARQDAGPRRLADMTSAADLVDEDAQREMNWVIALIEGVRSARAQMHVPAALQVKLLVSGLDENGRRAWERTRR